MNLGQFRTHALVRICFDWAENYGSFARARARASALIHLHRREPQNNVTSARETTRLRNHTHSPQRLRYVDRGKTVRGTVASETRAAREHVAANDGVAPRASRRATFGFRKSDFRFNDSRDR